MYQHITPWDWPLIVIVSMMMLVSVVFAYLRVGFKEKKKNYFIVATIGLILMVALLPLAGIAFEQDDKKHAAMKSNILTKYNSEVSPSYLKDVEYEGKRSREIGTYFKLTYSDRSTASVRFIFDNRTGEPKPRCDCDLKQIEAFSATPEFEQLRKSLGK